MKRVVDETDLLRPVDDATDSDDWPQFILNQAQVLDEDGQAANLLLAHHTRPRTVTGRLERLEKPQQRLLKRRDAVPADIRVTAVQQFAYGQYVDGEFAFWAAGEAGWYEIKPARSYRALHHEMMQAINILYFLADLFRDGRRKDRRRMDPETVLQLFADQPDHECKDSKEAYNLFMRHRTVLLELMAQGKEGVSWKGTPIYKLLKNNTNILNDLDNSDNAEENKSARFAGKGKSSLRPRTDQHSGKGKKRGPPSSHEVDDLNDMTSAPDPRHPKRRRRIDSNSFVAETEEPIADGNESSDSSPNTLVPKATYPPLPIKATATHNIPPQPTKPPPLHSVQLITTPIPTLASNRPGDAWACPFDGCNMMVYAASDSDSKDLIRDHYHQHAQDSQAKLDLVAREERPYLPVGHLVARIRELARGAKKSGPESEGSHIEPSLRESGRTLKSGRNRGGRGPIDAIIGADWPKPIVQRY